MSTKYGNCLYGSSFRLDNGDGVATDLVHTRPKEGFINMWGLVKLKYGREEQFLNY